MIRGYFGGPPGRLRPFIVAHVAIPDVNVAGDVHFLADTGADSTVLSPRDARSLLLPVTSLPIGQPSRGIGGTTPTRTAEALVSLGAHQFSITLRILTPSSSEQYDALRFIPSLLGRDIISRFALHVDLRTNRVLLLEPFEADALNLP